MNGGLVKFEFEKSPLRTIVYDGTGRGKTFFVRQYLKLYQNQMVEEDQKRIIIVCKDGRDWINPEIGKHYSDLNMCDIKEITSKNIDNFENCVIDLDDMGNKKNDKADFFAEGRHDDFQMIVLGHKPAQIVSTARMSSDTIYITTYNGADLFRNFIDTCKRKNDFHGIISELNNSYYNCAHGMAPELRFGMI